MSTPLVGTSWFVEALLLSLLLGGEVTSVVRVLSIAMLQMILALAICTRWLIRDDALTASIVGISTMLMVALNALLVVAGVRSTTLLLLLNLIPLALISIRAKTPLVPKTMPGDTALAILASPLLALAQWSVEIALLIALLAGGLLATRRNRLLTRAVTSIAIVTMFLIAVSRLPLHRAVWIDRMISNDILYDEATSAGLSYWGSADSMGLTGIPTRYHIISLAWVGQLQRLASANAFEVQLLLQPILIYAACASLILALVEQLHGRLRAKVVSLLFVFCQASSTETLFPIEFLKSNMTVGTLSALALLLLTLRFKSQKIGVTMLVFASAAFVAVGTKMHFALIAATGIGMATILQLRPLQSLVTRVRVLTPLVGIALGLAVGWLAFFAGSGGTDNTLTTSGLSIRHVASVITVALLLALSRLPIPILWRSRATRVEQMLLSTVSAAFGVYVLLGIFQSDEPTGRNYALTFGFVVAAPLVGKWFENLSAGVMPGRWRLSVSVGLALGTLATIGFDLLKWHLYERGGRAVVRGVLTSPVSSQLSILVIGIWIGALLRIHESRNYHTKRTSYSVALGLITLSWGLGAFLGKTIREPVTRFASGDVPEERIDAGYGTAEFTDLAKWLTKQTRRDDIIASLTPCIEQSRARVGSSCRDWQVGGLIIAAFTGRRMFLEAPVYMSDSTTEALLGGEIERRFAILQDVMDGSPERALVALRAEGVRFLVIDRTLYDQFSSHTPGIVFRNSRYEVLKL